MALVAFWEKTCITVLIPLMNHDNTTAAELGSSEAKMRAEKVTEAGAMKKTSLAGAISTTRTTRKAIMMYGWITLRTNSDTLSHFSTPAILDIRHTVLVLAVLFYIFPASLSSWSRFRTRKIVVYSTTWNRMSIRHFKTFQQ